jgi:hypothetical protein
MEILPDFEKLHCPFVRKLYKTKGKCHGMRNNEVYLAEDEINPGYEWVFDDPETFAVEKLDGTNVKIKTIDNVLVSIMNRKNPIDISYIKNNKPFLVEGVFSAIGKGYVQSDGIQAGEIVGPKLQGNPYYLKDHIWYPFEKSISSLRYKSFDKHERTYENWSSWFHNYLKSLFFEKHADDGNILAEGVIFYNLKRKAENKVYMAKLRRNMFEWFYTDEEVEIIK